MLFDSFICQNFVRFVGQISNRFLDVVKVGLHVHPSSYVQQFMS